ncbi:MAG: LysM peptidoglycan-binding domain-containing protein [Spirochaetia bacterium]|nr:LysM peptidoglycan-binding domain-containing protein [Spirochaetia bacterium]
MDGTPPDDYGRGKRKNEHKHGTNTHLLVIFLCVLVVLGSLFVYGVFIAPAPASSDKATVQETPQQVVQPSSSADLSSAPVTVGTTVVQPVADTVPSDSTALAAGDASAPTVTAKQDSSTTARDISTMKQDKADSLAVQFHQHVVQENQTLQDIATLYDLKIQTLISVNSIANVNAIKAGDILSIPDRDGHYYVVQSGDMLSTIAKRYSPNLGWETLMELNALTSENIKVGQKLFIPDVDENSSAASYARPASTFIRPCDGKITAMYGQYLKDNPNGDTPNLEGLMMEGKDVHASAEGSVADIGFQDDGLGRYVKVTHEGGYETVYGHLDEVSTTIGAHLDAGQAIGTCGTTGGGNLKKPSLYFAIYQNGFSLDPMNFFSK